MSIQVSEEEKRRKARIRSYRWYHVHKHEIREKVRQRASKYYYANRHRIKLTPEQWKRKLEWQKKWRAKNRDRIHSYEVKERENVQRVIKNRLCSRIRRVLNRNKIRKNSKTIILVGCTWKFLRTHIENQFLDGMSWENRSLWHIDHIRPCASFDLTNPLEQMECFHFSNLRPLWSNENMSKGCKWEAA